MKKIMRAAAFGGLFCSLGTGAVATEFPLVDTALLTHMVYGKGIEIRVRPDPLPAGGLHDEAVSAALQGICEYYAPVVVPHVEERLQLADAKFVAVRVVSADGLDDYRLRAFHLNGQNCGEPF